MQIDYNAVSRGKSTGQDMFGERGLQMGLDRPFQWSGAVDWVETGLSQEIFRSIGNFDLDILFIQPRRDIVDLNIGNGPYLCWL